MSMTQMKTCVLTTEWSTGIYDVIVRVGAVRSLSAGFGAGGALGAVQVMGGYMPRTAGRPAVVDRAMLGSKLPTRHRQHK